MTETLTQETRDAIAALQALRRHPVETHDRAQSLVVRAVCKRAIAEIDSAIFALDVALLEMGGSK